MKVEKKIKNNFEKYVRNKNIKIFFKKVLKKINIRINGMKQ